MRPGEIEALAVDYDRTLTGADLEPVPEALDALALARKHGRKVVVVSGRGVAFLREKVGHVADAIVGENGCILLDPSGEERRLGDAGGDLRGALACLDIPLEHGRVLVSADVEHEPLLRETLERAGLEADLIRNQDRVMLLPRGIDKAVGVVAALEALGVDPARCAAAGDGENDVVMLRAVGHAIAVGNAVPELLAVADHVTKEDGGHGVARWILDEWLAVREAA